MPSDDTLVVSETFCKVSPVSDTANRPKICQKDMLESGKVKNLTEIAALEGVDNSYVSRMVNLTTLAPDIVEAILEDALPDHLTLFDLAVDPPALWEEQRLRIWSG